MDDSYHLKCTKCGKVIKEDYMGYVRNNGKPHNYFWNAPAGCDGVLMPEDEHAKGL